MKACIVQDFTRTGDGLQKNSLVVIETLKEHGYEVNLCSLRSPNIEGARHNFETDLTALISSTTSPRFIFRNSYKLNLLRSTIKHFALPDEPDVCINMMANWFPFIKPKDPRKLIMYVGALPKVPILEQSGSGNFLKKGYSKMINFVATKKLNKLLQDATVLTPSASLKKALSQIWKVDAKILYPPINFTAYQASLEEIKQKDQNTIALSGRIHRFKKLEIGLSVAERIPSSDVRFIGASDSESYLKFLNTKIMESCAKERVKLHLDKPLDVRVNLLKRSKVFLQAAVGEGFGGVVAEAMAAGCIPVVHNSGGPVEFVPSKWRYDDFEELLKKVIDALAASTEEHMEMVKLAEQFRTELYKESLLKILESIN